MLFFPPLEKFCLTCVSRSDRIGASVIKESATVLAHRANMFISVKALKILCEDVHVLMVKRKDIIHFVRMLMCWW